MDGTNQSTPPAADGEKGSGFFTVGDSPDTAAANPPADSGGPDAGGGGAGEGDGGEPASAVTFVHTPRNGQPETITVPPEFLREDGTIDAERAVVRAIGLRHKLSERGFDPDQEGAAAPESYTVRVPDELADMVHVGEADPDHPKPITIGPDDPLLAALTPVLQEMGIGQDGADRLIGAYLGVQAAQHRDAVALAAADDKADLEAIVAHFGSEDAAREKLTGELAPWLKQMVTGDENARQSKYAVLNELGKSAPVCLALWDIYQGVRGAGMVTPQPGSSAPARLTRDDLRQMMAEPAYSDPTNPGYHAMQKRVADGYRTLGE